MTPLLTGFPQSGRMDLESRFGLRPFAFEETGLALRQWRAAKRDLQRIRRGIYAVRWAPDARLRHCQKVCAELLPRTNHLAIGASALAILDLPNPYFRSWDRVDVTVGGPKTRTSTGILRSRLDPIPTPWGPCTDLLDTAAHIAGELPLPQALMVTDAVARHLAGTTDRFWLASERCRTEVRRRLLEVANLPALRLADPAAESPAESFFRGHVLEAGLRDLKCGVPMKGASGDQYFVDLLIDGLIVEVDGREKYKNLQVLIAEKRREDDLRATGRGFHRSFVEDLYADPKAEVDRLTHRLRLALPA